MATNNPNLNPQTPTPRTASVPQRQAHASVPQGQMSGVSGAPAAPEKHTGRNVIVVLGIVIAVVVIWVLLWMFACNGASLFDPNAQNGQAPYKTNEEIQAELDRVVDEGMFNISIASVIEFDDGQSEGIAYIENVPNNHYNMQVTITEDDTGEVLYESGVLAPNQYIENIALTKDLDPGTYPCTANFKALDPNTFDEVGQASAVVSIVVMD